MAQAAVVVAVAVAQAAVVVAARLRAVVVRDQERAAREPVLAPSLAGVPGWPQAGSRLAAAFRPRSR